jgi:hypothetical protein
LTTSPYNRVAVAMLLLAAAACYADVPRLHVVSNLGSLINAARMLDAMSHIRLVQNAQTPEELGDLDDGRQSLELVNANPRLPAAVPHRLSYRPPTLAPQDGGMYGFAALVSRPESPFTTGVAARPPPGVRLHDSALTPEPCRGFPGYRGPPHTA